ncbi:hypothetical protein [Geobacter sp.]|uniref:Ig-like domain-containing protein n=1 Tax=Geobacter sp. TaxID=46610 RepID=UPI00262B3848|nr:hypothetical protein [Geobacter sp.]
MKLRNMLFAVLSILALVITGCGGGGGGGPTGTVVSGVASKGLISGATVKVFEIISSHNPARSRVASTPLGQTTTGTDGFYAVNIGSVTNKSLLVEVSGGNYRDEATGATTTLAAQFPNGLRAVFGNISGVVKRTGGMTLNVTPFTEMAYEDATQGGAQPNNVTIAASNAKIATAFFGSSSVDIVLTRPVNITSAVSYNAGTTAQQTYALQLATLSQYQAAVGGGQTLDTIATALLGSIDPTTSQLPANTQTALTDATYSFLINPLNTNSATKDPNAPNANPNLPASVTIAAAVTTASINTDQVAITATVRTKTNTAVPAGTPVTFAIASGTGTLSATSAVTDASGVASVNLSSTAVNTVTVNATSVAASTTTPATVNFVNPNAPQSMTVTSSAPAAFLNGSLTLTANVTRAAGGPVPDGTVVNFAVTSGTGTLGTPTTTVGGAATVTLTSAVAGAVTVTATAGTVTTPVTVNFVVKPTTAIVKVATSGTLPAGIKIGTVTANLVYPAAKVVSSSIVGGASGVGASGATPGVNVFFVATPDPTSVLLLWTDLNNVGIGTGEFATVTFSISSSITPDTIPTASDFSIDPNYIVGDNTVNAATINGISVIIPPNGVTIQ